MAVIANLPFRIVIIDDEKKIIQLIKKIVDWEGLNCSVSGEAYNGIDGLDLIGRQKPDIVLTDIRMPGMDGINLMRKAREEQPDCLFIFISGYNDFEYVQSALNLGALGYVLKPIDKMQIEDLIRKGGEKIKQSRENRMLKEIASSNINEYFEVIDSYISKNLYTFFNSDMENRLINCMKQCNKNEVTHLLDNIFNLAMRNNFDLVHVRKLGVEICAGYLKNFSKELNSFDEGINFAEYFKNCTQISEIKKSLVDYSYKVIDALYE